ncbi:hypothetical protein [uncultured Oscillibacter sp.]|uniref:hypothetical protein n=1 Tax=uncultured Oscillibacter sp. TaxID=876091 RepID=UPI00263941CA|nr:hypothetical protein [uncultured Oscillibacter sp.]
MHFRFQEKLILNGGLQQIADALVGGQHIADRGGRTTETGQGPEDILQLLTLSVENMAQSKLLHRDGRKDLIDRIFALDGRINIRKTGQRHRRLSFQMGPCREYAAAAKQELLFTGAVPEIVYALALQHVPAGSVPYFDFSCFISKLMKQPTAGGGILGQHHPGSSTIRA